MKNHMSGIFAKAFLSALVVVSAFLVYHKTLSFGYVYDDLVIVQHNQNLSKTSNVPLLFTKKYFEISGERTFRPVNTFSYMLDRHVWKDRAFGYHLTNIIMHCICAVFLFLTASLICRNNIGGLFAAMLFALHPMNTEAVAPVSFREDVMAMMFVIAAFYIYVAKLHLDAAYASKKPGLGIWRAAAIGILYFLGLGSKESAAVLPLIIIVYEWFCGGEATPPSQRVSRAAEAVSAMAISGGVFFFIYFKLQATGVSPEATMPGSTAYESFAVMLSAFLNYIRIAFYPANLCADYIGLINSNMPKGLFFILAALPIGILYFSFTVRKAYPGTSFGLLFFLISLLPVSNIIPFGAVFAERYAYMPGAGLAIAVALLFFEEETSPIDCARISPFPWFHAVFLSMACIVCASMAIERTGVWKNEYKLWKDTVQCCASSPRAQTNLGRALLHREEYDNAIIHLEKSLELDDENYETHIALGTAYFKVGRNYEAIRHFSVASRIKPEAKYTFYNLALVYSELGNYKKARNNLHIALKLDPGYVEAKYTLSGILLKMGDFAGAEKLLDEVLEKKPENSQALGNLALVYIETGRPEKAKVILDDLLKKLPKNDRIRKTVELNLDRINNKK